MKLALTLLTGITVLGCSHESDSPTAPTSQVPPDTSASIWAVVVADDSGMCLDGATVQVVAGQALGRSETQTATPCDVWYGDGAGVIFGNLSPGVEMTLRASASGYAAQQRKVIPTTPPQGAVIFTLSRSLLVRTESFSHVPHVAFFVRPVSWRNQAVSLVARDSVGLLSSVTGRSRRECCACGNPQAQPGVSPQQNHIPIKHR
jgi:hypothetical protein